MKPLPAKIQFPSGVYYVRHSRALVNTLFQSGGTGGGTFKKTKRGIMFFSPDGSPEFFLKFSYAGDPPFFISATRTADGRIWYSHLSTPTREKLFPGATYSGEREIASRIADQFQP